jgi:hypothetical protein
LNKTNFESFQLRFLFNCIFSKCQNIKPLLFDAKPGVLIFVKKQKATSQVGANLTGSFLRRT